ncbi:MAG TPA: PxKF domain-containing protein [Nocardioidaceae bacterium]|nr:PxKF domain-containing protein [Nocardioidaceae bacterium]
MRARKLTAALAAVPLILASATGVAFADLIDNTIDVDPAVATISAGGSVNVGYRIFSENQGTDGQQGCNAADSTPLTLTLTIPNGVTATGSTLKPGNQLVFTQCGQPQTLSFSASTAGNYPITAVWSDGGPGRYTNNADWTLKVTAPAPTNTKPSITLSGVTDGASYEIGSEPSPVCNITDTEDGNSTKAATISGSLSHGLGTLTATCDYTDEGGLAADTVRSTYRIVDTGNPTISHDLSSTGSASAYGWYNQDVTVTFTCADSGSGIQSCVADGESGDSKTLGEGAAQSVTGTATDWAGNTATDTASGINVDKTTPTGVTFVGGPVEGGKYYPNNLPAAPTCTADDPLSGLASCVVTGYSNGLGDQVMTATATDKAGNTTEATRTYRVRKLSLTGFYAPVDKGIHNTVKSGATVPLKFEVFDEGTELREVSKVKGFSTRLVSCSTGLPEDAIEEVAASTSASGLRFDTTSDSFIYNWKTSGKAGTCIEVKVTTEDDSAISALFKLK